MSNDVHGIIKGLSIQAANINGDVLFAPRSELNASPPKQLPPSPRHFTDRLDSVAELDHILTTATEAGTAALALISGPPGVGKTSLALSWLHDRAAEFPGGQLYADMQGNDLARPVSPSDILPGFLRALGVAPDHVPAELADQAALYRTLTASRRVSVLCDNALSAAQVRPLIPASSGSVCLVTSRWRLTSLLLDGASIVQLEPLDTDSALELLVRIAGTDRVSRDDEAARELVRSSGRFPLAVCVGAALLSFRPGWSVATAAASLFSGPQAVVRDEEISMNACLDQVYAALPNDAATLYRRLSMHPGPEFSAEVAEVVAQAKPVIPQATEQVAVLADANLLTMVRPGRYRFHDLIRQHARTQLGKDHRSLREETRRRLTDYYLATANSADAVVYPKRRRPAPVYSFPDPPTRSFTDAATALNWLDTERGNLMAVQRLAADEGHPEAAWQLADAMWGLFSYMRYSADWITIHRIGVEAARACQHVLGEARLVHGLAIALREAGDYDEALRVFEEALELRRRLEDRRGEGMVKHNMGVVFMRKGEYDRAIPLFRESIAIRHEEGDIRGEGRGLAALGEVESLTGRYESSIRNLQSALEMGRESGDQYFLAWGKRLLGEAYLRAGEPSAAREQLMSALQIINHIGEIFEMGTIHAALAAVAEEEGDYAAAREHLERGAAVYRRLGAIAEAEHAEGRLRLLEPPK